MNFYQIPESRHYSDKLFAASPSVNDLLTSSLLSCKLQARFSKVEKQNSNCSRVGGLKFTSNKEYKAKNGLSWIGKFRNLGIGTEW